METCGQSKLIWDTAFRIFTVVMLLGLIIGIGMMLVDKQKQAADECMIRNNCSASNSTCCMTLLSPMMNVRMIE
jgi:hypothetical protein